VQGGSVTPNLFGLLGLQPAIGRGFRAEDAEDFGFADRGAREPPALRAALRRPTAPSWARASC
jgi:hypothetical protein